MRNRARGSLSLVGLAAVLLFGCGATPAAACPPAKPARFEAGSDTLTLTGDVARGARVCYTIPLRYGQRLVIVQGADPSALAVFQVYRPPWRVERAEPGVAVTGATLPGTEDGRDATRFDGRVPVTGDYLLVIGATPGGGAYRITIGAR